MARSGVSRHDIFMHSTLPPLAGSRALPLNRIAASKLPALGIVRVSEIDAAEDACMVAYNIRVAESAYLAADREIKEYLAAAEVAKLAA